MAIMDIAEVEIAPEEWGDIVSKYPANSLKVKPSDFTASTKNIDTDNKGVIVKRRGMVDYSTLPASPKDQYEAIFSDGVHHLLTVDGGNLRYSSGDGVENLVTAGYSAILNFEFETIKDRVYFGNTVTAQVYDRTASYGGVGYTAPQTKVMGAQAPTVAPAVAVVAGGSVPVGGHTYKITFVYYSSEESNGGPASAVATTSAGNQTVNLSSIQIGGYGVTSRKIYRDNNDGNWVHVGTLDNNTATVFSDTVAVGATPTPVPTDNGVPPAFGLITLWLDRAWLSKIAGEPYTLYYSEAGLPDIFPANNRRICNQKDPISAHIVYRGRMVVWNRNSMGYIEGSTPETFKYVDIQGSVGCVDNRTMQIRVVEGVPIVVWLSDKGFYSYNGSSIDYISDPIEDLVNFNIQQAVLQKGRNSQTTQTDFTNGTPSNGINLTSFPGFITTRAYDSGSSSVGANPRRTWDDQTDWEGGSIKSNVVTRDGTNQLKSPTKFQPTLASGTLAGQAQIVSNVLRLPQSTAFNGETGGTTTTYTHPGPGAAGFFNVAVPIIPTRSGTLTAVKARLGTQAGTSSFPVTIQTDLGGQPSGTSLGSGTLLSATGPTTLVTSSAMSVSLTGGVKYWIVFQKPASINIRSVLQGSQLSGGGTLTREADGFLQLQGTWGNPRGITAAAGYNFTYSNVAASGTWTSPVHDTKCAFFDTAKAFNISIQSAFFPFLPGSNIQFDVQGSNDPSFVLFTTVSVDGAGVTSNSHNLQNFRYWRLKLTLSTNNDVFTPTTTGTTLAYTTNVTVVPQEWVSEAIDCTADVTTYNGLSMVTTTPAGTAVTMTIATSIDNITYSSFVSFGSHVVRRYAKVKLVLNMNSAQDATPSVTSVNFTWTIVANHISSIIDTAASPPAGWDIFQAAIANSGAGIVFQMRSSASAGTIGAATFFTITNGDFPNAVTPLQFVQWKVIITATDNNVPSIDSITVNWFIGNTNSIRPASIFFGGRYYCALAEFNQTTNNLIIEIDLKGKWRIYRGLNVATFSLFFNQPYAGLSDIARIVKFLQGLTDRGVAIEVDIRTPAYEFNTFKRNNSNRYKVVHKFFLEGRNTGATYQVFFSVDDGTTFTAMVDDSGNSSFTTATDNKLFYKRLQAVHGDNDLVSGRTIMYRILSADINDIEIHKYKAMAFVRTGEPVVTN